MQRLFKDRLRDENLSVVCCYEVLIANSEFNNAYKVFNQTILTNKNLKQSDWKFSCDLNIINNQTFCIETTLFKIINKQTDDNQDTFRDFRGLY